MHKKGIVKWVNVEKTPTGAYQINSTHKYFILAAQLLDGTIEYNANNILLVVDDLKYMDLMSAESDFFTRLNFFASAELHYSNMRSGSSLVKLFAQVQIIEYEF